MGNPNRTPVRSALSFGGASHLTIGNAAIVLCVDVGRKLHRTRQLKRRRRGVRHFFPDGFVLVTACVKMMEETGSNQRPLFRQAMTVVRAVFPVVLPTVSAFFPIDHIRFWCTRAHRTQDPRLLTTRALTRRACRPRRKSADKSFASVFQCELRSSAWSQGLSNVMA